MGHDGTVYAIEYERKGIDVWWTLIATTPEGESLLGRGIIPYTLWGDFLFLFRDNPDTSLIVKEVRL